MSISYQQQPPQNFRHIVANAIGALRQQTGLEEFELGVQSNPHLVEVVLTDILDILPRILDAKTYELLYSKIDAATLRSVARYIRLMVLDAAFFQEHVLTTSKSILNGTPYARKTVFRNAVALDIVVLPPDSPLARTLGCSLQVFLPVQTTFNNSFLAVGQWVDGYFFYNNYAEDYGFQKTFGVDNDHESQNTGYCPIPFELQNDIGHLVLVTGTLLGILNF